MCNVAMLRTAVVFRNNHLIFVGSRTILWVSWYPLFKTSNESACQFKSHKVNLDISPPALFCRLLPSVPRAIVCVTVENKPPTVKLCPQYVLVYDRMPNYTPLMGDWCVEM